MLHPGSRHYMANTTKDGEAFPPQSSMSIQTHNEHDGKIPRKIFICLPLIRCCLHASLALLNSNLLVWSSVFSALCVWRGMLRPGKIIENMSKNTFYNRYDPLKVGKLNIYRVAVCVECRGYRTGEEINCAGDFASNSHFSLSFLSCRA